nr:MAG TPA: hypothetical protein [Caudoviricetes sp.]
MLTYISTQIYRTYLLIYQNGNHLDKISFILAGIFLSSIPNVGNSVHPYEKSEQITDKPFI